MELFREEKKDGLRDKGQHFEEKWEPNKARVDDEIKYSIEKEKHNLIK